MTRNAKIILALDHLTIDDLEWFIQAARIAGCIGDYPVTLDHDINNVPAGITIEMSRDDPK